MTKEQYADPRDRPGVAEAYIFWNQWLQKKCFYQPTAEVTPNTHALYDAAFRAYLQLKDSNHKRWFLFVECDENDCVKISAASKEGPVDGNANMRRFFEDPIDPKYFLIVFRRQGIMFVFRKLHNYTPFFIATQDVDSVFQFRQLCGSYKFSSTVLRDD